ncbi:MAG: prepilin peptidase, partial [Pseudomonadota bacterium]
NELIFKAFAIIREVSSRTLNKRHFDVQLFAGWLMIKGQLAEMATGEGKTLSTSLPACTAALAGIPVHVITANDYLAERDAQTLQPLYQGLGIAATAVVESMDAQQRRVGYTADIVHTTNKQIAFDYLRDRITIGEDTGPLRLKFRQIHNRQKSEGLSIGLLPGLCFALVDEADNVLVDEANTPLIITKSLPSELDDQHYADALYLASNLLINYDYKIDSQNKTAELTGEGEGSLAELSLSMPKFWHSQRRCHALVVQALIAVNHYKKDRDYIIHADKIHIVDQSSGRTMADRSWEQGLHQMIEAKEGCSISFPREPVARISYQRFFSRYLHLAGTSGTIREVAGELEHVYGLYIKKVPTHQPSKRIFFSERVYRDKNAQRTALIKRVKQILAKDRPILIGTTSVIESETVSKWLQQNKILHRVLNAKQNRNEAKIIAQAGQKRAVTVATNMAGRGTDIALGKGINAKGGLHVIAVGVNNSSRVDRQLYGRCARQGDNGSAEAILSLEDPVLVNHYSSTTLKLLNKLTTKNRPMPRVISKWVLGRYQYHFEKHQSLIRKRLVKQDKLLQRVLAFAGKFE